MTYKTNLSGTTATFSKMMKRFGVVTVMNASVYDTSAFLAEDQTIAEYFKGKSAYDVIKDAEGKTALCTLDTLKTANVTVDGPDKTINGGQYSNPLIKFGKSARLEIQDALGNSEALEAMCGGFQEWSTDTDTPLTGVHFGEDFSGPKTIIGDSFFIDQQTGTQVAVKIIFYQFLPDSLFNLTQDSEGDAAVFDMNGDLLTTVIKVGNGDGSDSLEHGVFYSIVDPSAETA